MDYELINFFENLVINLKTNNISDNDKVLLKYFYTQYNLKNIIDDDKNLNKYLVYGWYLNSIISNK